MTALADQIEITVPGPPAAKQRPRMTMTGHVYTPKKTVDHENVIADHAIDAMRGRHAFSGPVSVRVTAYFEIPPSWPKWKRNAALAGSVRHTGVPDADNLIKLCLDSLNGTGIWPDDSYVVNFSVAKEYAAVARTEILIFSAPGFASSTVKRDQVQP